MQASDVTERVASSREAVSTAAGWCVHVEPAAALQQQCQAAAARPPGWQLGVTARMHTAVKSVRAWYVPSAWWMYEWQLVIGLVTVQQLQAGLARCCHSSVCCRRCACVSVCLSSVSGMWCGMSVLCWALLVATFVCGLRALLNQLGPLCIQRAANSAGHFPACCVSPLASHLLCVLLVVAAVAAVFVLSCCCSSISVFCKTHNMCVALSAPLSCRCIRSSFTVHR